MFTTLFTKQDSIFSGSKRLELPTIVWQHCSVRITLRHIYLLSPSF